MDSITRIEHTMLGHIIQSAIRKAHAAEGPFALLDLIYHNVYQRANERDKKCLVNCDFGDFCTRQIHHRDTWVMVAYEEDIYFLADVGKQRKMQIFNKTGARTELRVGDKASLLYDGRECCFRVDILEFNHNSSKGNFPVPNAYGHLFWEAKCYNVKPSLLSPSMLWELENNEED